MNTISFMSANYVARQVGFRMESWEHGDKATNEHYKPLETFEERFDELLRTVRGLGFTAIDLWQSHLNDWATAEHIAIARKLLRQHNFKVTSYQGWLGSRADKFEAFCKLAVQLGTPLLSGMTPVLENERATAVAILKHYGLKFGLENHPEKTAAEILAKIGDGGNGTIGTTVDTGWYGTQGYDAALAIEQLRDHLLHVHLKDVRHAGEPHETCGYGQGVVPIRECVKRLKQIGYQGAISIEHEPDHYDPSEEVRAGAALVREWMSEG